MYQTNHTFAICAYGESPFLEECIQSCIGQTERTNILLATSTPNAYIKNLGGKYGIPVYVNRGGRAGLHRTGILHMQGAARNL